MTNKVLRYWDPEIQPEKYSFVDFAISKGYSVFFYDRLGISKSSVLVTLLKFAFIPVTYRNFPVSLDTSRKFPLKSPS